MFTKRIGEIIKEMDKLKKEYAESCTHLRVGDHISIDGRQGVLTNLSCSSTGILCGKWKTYNKKTGRLGNFEKRLFSYQINSADKIK